MKKMILDMEKCYQENKIDNMIEGVGGGQYERGHLKKSWVRR